MNKVLLVLGSLFIEDNEYILKENGDINFDGKTKSINLI